MRITAELRDSEPVPRHNYFYIALVHHETTITRFSVIVHNNASIKQCGDI